MKSLTQPLELAQQHLKEQTDTGTLTVVTPADPFSGLNKLLKSLEESSFTRASADLQASDCNLWRALPDFDW